MSQTTYDFIIVGAGAAGCVVAARLAEDPTIRVALIEAGGDYTKNPNIYTPSKHLLLWDAPFYQPPFQPDFDAWSFKTQGSDNSDHNNEYIYPRGTGYGGSTNHNSLIMLRGSRKPYDRWAELSKDESWSYNNLLPYFKKLENNENSEVETEFRGKSGWLHMTKYQPEAIEIDIVKAALDMGIPYVKDTNGNPESIAGVSQWDNSINRTTGHRSYAAVDLLLPIMNKNRNITIFDYSLATRILFNNPKRGQIKAIGVEFLKAKYNYSASIQFQKPQTRELRQIFAAKEVIICGGAFNSPQLLMLSGIGIREHLESLDIPVLVDLPVGDHLLDHMEVTVIHEVDTVYSKQICQNNYLPIIPEMTKDKQHAGGIASPILKVLGASGIMSQVPKVLGTNLADDACHLIYQSSGLGPRATGGHCIGIDWSPPGMSVDPLCPLIHVGSIPDYFKDFDLKAWMGEQNLLKTYHTFLIEITQPKANHGTVRLRSKRPTDTPIINERLDNDHDLSVLAGGIQFVRNLMENKFLNRYKANEIRPGRDYETIDDLKHFLRENSLFGHHCSGTVKFGHQDDDTAVLDSQLRVKGIANLRVVDASVFPTIVSYNPNLPIYCIAEKISDVIKQTWGTSSPQLNFRDQRQWKITPEALEFLLMHLSEYHPELVLEELNVHDYFKQHSSSRIARSIVKNNGLVTLPIVFQWIENNKSS